MRANWLTECGVVIPCLNEAAAIADLVREVRRWLPVVVVIDDGSSDETAQRAETSGATVLRHRRNQGKGAAIATGLTWLVQRQFSWGLVMDGDGQHAPVDIEAFLERAEQTNATLIVGNRMAEPEGMPWLRRIANRWMSARLTDLTGYPLPDSQCGFRLLNLSAWSTLHIVTQHFEVESELLVAYLQAGQRVEFVPVRVIYGTERTKISPLLDAWRWGRWWRTARRSFPCEQTKNPRAPRGTRG